MLARQTASAGIRDRTTRNALDPVTSTPPTPRQPFDSTPTHPTSSSAAAAAAAAFQSDGYKPREEKSWEEFHPDLDIDSKMIVFSADEVDGLVNETSSIGRGRFSRRPSDLEIFSGTISPREGVQYAHSPTQDVNGDNTDGQAYTPSGNVDTSAQSIDISNAVFTPRRRPGRPPRRPQAMLHGLGSPPAPRIVPIPTQNPRERLNLPKPSFRAHNPFLLHEADRDVQVNYVDKSMANVGFQESEEFARPERKFIRLEDSTLEEDLASGLTLESDLSKDGSDHPTVVQVEYDMDEQDLQWLSAYNAYRKESQLAPIKPAIFEITMTQIEKEWHALEKRIPKPNPKPPQTQRPRSSSAAAVNGEPAAPGEEQDSKCAICDDGDCENTNAIVFCDGCDLAVHQECYGVPFIPEGQWLCRKCQSIGRGIPTCIFCPNVEGAFKLTQESRWAHLLCSIWIPEVTLGNITFMEPIMDVAKVPKSRWKLNCYICNQRMGACIQCGNRNCYLAFHVTCARRAKLYLKMKSTHGGPATLDASVLKALCDKHVPSEWAREHDVATATAKAKAYYRKNLRGQLWADSQESALALLPSQHFEGAQMQDLNLGLDINQTGTDVAGQKRKRAEAQKNIWRLPSGAPVVPKVVLEAVENILQRFTVAKRKDYAAEACKYWTLKREARRGASLLKRLQLQMETFSSSELSRRDFSAMGAAGGPRLKRRIEFATKLTKEMAKLKKIAEKTKEREAEKLRDAELLKQIVDTIYFPITPLLWPILRKAQHLDPKGVFYPGFRKLQLNLESRQYTSVASFSADLGSVFSSVLRHQNDQDHKTTVPDDGHTTSAPVVDLKEAKGRAKRITKAIQPLLEEATRNEAELGGRPYEKELKSLEALLNHSIRLPSEGTLSNGNATLETENERHEFVDDADAIHIKPFPVNGTSSADRSSTTPAETNGDDSHSISSKGRSEVLSPDRDHHDEISFAPNHYQLSNGISIPGSRFDNIRQSGDSETAIPSEPLTPPSSEKALLAPFASGGIPWYLEPFDPVGTTVYDERWTGREVLRSMSEELSEIDDEDLKGLGGSHETDTVAGGDVGHVKERNIPKTRSTARKGRKRSKRFK